MRFSFGSKLKKRKVLAVPASLALIAGLVAIPGGPTAMAQERVATPSGEGYWMVATDGGVFAFGDAGFYGSLGDRPLNKPITGMVPTPSGNGYWLVASDGGIFAFGDAEYFGSTGNIRLNQPIVGMANSGEEASFSGAGADGATGPRGSTGPAGSAGAQGPAGPAGPPGSRGQDATYVGADWSIIDRNVIGNGDSYLRAGPGSGLQSGAGSIAGSVGQGSLGMRTGSASDKTAFGNSTLFAGSLIKDLTAVSYSVFTTGENRGAPAAPNSTPTNLPSLIFEIDPNLGAPYQDKNFSSLVFMPADAAASAWTAIDATTSGMWGLTGMTGSPCDINGARCTFAQMQSYLNNPSDTDPAPATVTLSVAFSKGRDLAFSGAVDNLRINQRLFDFEPFGVRMSVL